MKQYLPYNALMVVAVLFAGITVFYNLALRDSFSVLVKYAMPAIAEPAQETVVVESAGESDDSDKSSDSNKSSEMMNESADEYFDEDEPALTSVTFPLDINRATVEELRFIPQVGDVTAQRIVQYREVLGGYTELEQLMEIKGVGNAAFERIAAYLYIAEEE